MKADAVRRLEAGETLTAVARDHDVASCVVFEWRRQSRLPKRERRGSVSNTKKKRSGPLPIEVKEAVLRDLAAGKPWKAMSEEHDIPPSTIYRWAKQSGRFLFGSDAPRIGAAGEDQPNSAWWASMPDLDESFVRKAVALLNEGITRAEFSRQTGLSQSRSTTFAAWAHAKAGTRKFKPLRYVDSLRPSHEDTSIDWASEEPFASTHFPDRKRSLWIPGSRSYREEVRTEALQRFDAGESPISIARSMGICASSLRNWRRKRKEAALKADQAPSEAE